MTLEEFIEEFKKIKNDFHWVNMKQIRGTHKDKEGKCFCPITAVCYAKTGEFHLASKYQVAAKSIGLNYLDASEIVLAADAPGRPHRRKLLKIVRG